MHPRHHPPRIQAIIHHAPLPCPHAAAHCCHGPRPLPLPLPAPAPRRVWHLRTARRPNPSSRALIVAPLLGAVEACEAVQRCITRMSISAARPQRNARQSPPQQTRQPALVQEPVRSVCTHAAVAPGWLRRARFVCPVMPMPMPMPMLCPALPCPLPAPAPAPAQHTPPAAASTAHTLHPPSPFPQTFLTVVSAPPGRSSCSCLRLPSRSGRLHHAMYPPGTATPQRPADVPAGTLPSAVDVASWAGRTAKSMGNVWATRARRCEQTNHRPSVVPLLPTPVHAKGRGL